jgi:hypothetical protein
MLRWLGELSTYSGRRRRLCDRRGRSGGLAGRRRLRLRLRLRRRLPAGRALLRSNACLGRRCVDTRSRRPGSGRRRRRGVRRRDRPVVRPVDGRRGDDDPFGRRCTRTRSGPDRGKVHGARVEEQSHRGRAEEQRNHRRRHSPSDYPDCEPLPASVGRHRPLLPFPGRASLGLGTGIQETRSDGNPGTPPTFAVSGESLPTWSDACEGVCEAASAVADGVGEPHGANVCGSPRLMT